MRIALLSLQGAFAEHRHVLEGLGASCCEIRGPQDLQTPFDGLVLPGGESTVQGKLLRELNLLEPLRRKIAGGLPVLGTCAGLILLAETIDSGENPHLGTLAVTVRRNAYGRQLGSFQTVGELRHIGRVPMTFIRGPYITRAGEGVEILATVDDRVVAVRQGFQLGVAFHPELTDSTAVHAYFLEMVRQSAGRVPVGA